MPINASCSIINFMRHLKIECTSRQPDLIMSFGDCEGFCQDGQEEVLEVQTHAIQQVLPALKALHRRTVQLNREHGTTICQNNTGKIKLGPVSVGTPTSVTISLDCPAGFKAMETFHTHHLSGRPSPQDIQSTLASWKAGAIPKPSLCISNPSGGVNCYIIKTS